MANGICNGDDIYILYCENGKSQGKIRELKKKFSGYKKPRNFDILVW